MNKFLALMLFFSSFNAVADGCNASTAIGFLNGVNTTRKEADNLAAKLNEISLNDVTLFYNHTQGAAFDLIEAFSQRQAELPPAVRNRWEMFSQVMYGNGAQLAEIVRIAPSYPLLVNAMRSAQLAAQSNSLSPIMQQDYAEHDRQLARLIATPNAHVTLIAHSQGNLFANHLFERLSDRQRDHVKLIHIAPASINLHGPYVLADGDIVIGVLAQHVEPNVSIPYPAQRLLQGGDGVGHGMLETYLNPNFDTYNRVLSLMRASDGVFSPSGIYRGKIVQNDGQTYWETYRFKARKAADGTLISGDWGNGIGCGGTLKQSERNPNDWIAITQYGRCFKEASGRFDVIDSGLTCAQSSARRPSLTVRWEATDLNGVVYEAAGQLKPSESLSQVARRFLSDLLKAEKKYSAQKHL